MNIPSVNEMPGREFRIGSRRYKAGAHIKGQSIEVTSIEEGVPSLPFFMVWPPKIYFGTEFWVEDPITQDLTIEKSRPEFRKWTTKKKKWVLDFRNALTFRFGLEFIEPYFVPTEDRLFEEGLSPQEASVLFQNNYHAWKEDFAGVSA